MNLQMDKPQAPAEPVSLVETSRHRKNASATHLHEFEYWDHEWFKRPDENEGRP
jgi:hypothetical protein